MAPTDKLLLTLKISTELDIVFARRRARQIAEVVGLGTSEQTRLATATSEVARNAFRFAGGGTLKFWLDNKEKPYMVAATITDHGSGIDNISEILSGPSKRLGIRSARRLVDVFDVSTGGQGTTITLKMTVPDRSEAFSDSEVKELIGSASGLVNENAADEVYAQNQELASAMDQLRREHEELEKSINRETVLRSARDKAIEAANEKTRFLSTVSHEVRTPLASVMGVLELLAHGSSETERELAQKGFEESRRLLRIVNNLLDASKLGAGSVKLVNSKLAIKALLGDVVQLWLPEATKNNVFISSRCAADVPEYVYGDELRLRQILSNLVSNAVKFTADGQVQVACELLNQPNTGCDLIRFTVEDTGIGMSDEQQESLFQPFIQAEDSTKRINGGVGLGLSICKYLIDLMGGRIWVQSCPGRGSRFWCDIPFSQAE